VGRDVADARLFCDAESGLFGPVSEADTPKFAGRQAMMEPAGVNCIDRQNKQKIGTAKLYARDRGHQLAGVARNPGMKSWTP
jgi:hypothetical protein